jgi:hypothetical protein
MIGRFYIPERAAGRARDVRTCHVEDSFLSERALARAVPLPVPGWLAATHL